MRCKVYVLPTDEYRSIFTIKYKGLIRNSLTVQEFVGFDRSRKPLVRCACLCGGFRISRLPDVISGKTKSCGCKSGIINEKIDLYGNSHSNELYQLYQGMLARCGNISHVAYKNYGGRGIKVCQRWVSKGIGFIFFLEDMNARPSKKHSIDRIDNDGNYSCGKCEECIESGWTFNCRWSSQKEQTNNKAPTYNRYVVLEGKTLTVTQWCEVLGLSKNTIWKRINRYKWRPEKALTYNLNKVKKEIY